MESDMWATLPCELLLQIFRRLGSTEVIRSAAVCRPWRRVIIDNASCIQPRPDRFLPDLLLAFVDTYWGDGRLKYAPAVAESLDNVPALDGVEVSHYDTLLASRDGFLLLGRNTVPSSLCLCNPLIGSRRIVPAAVFGRRSDYCNYILVTAYDEDSLPDGDGADSSLVVRILAVVREDNGITYRIFSSTSGGACGPVKRLAMTVQEDLGRWHISGLDRSVVVCGGSIVYWLVMSFSGNESSYCLFAMDMRTERTWTTELPEEGDMTRSVLATSENGRRLSLIVSRRKLCEVAVWVLDGDSQWTLQRTIEMQRLILTNCRITVMFSWVYGFCPRSGCLFGICHDEQGHVVDFHIRADGTSARLIDRATTGCSYMLLQYEMDWSTYISKMKYL